MKVLLVSTAGAGDPTKISVPFHIAVNGSAAVGQEAAIVLAGDGAELVIDDNANSIEGVGLPPMRELLARTKELGIPIYV